MLGIDILNREGFVHRVESVLKIPHYQMDCQWIEYKPKHYLLQNFEVDKRKKLASGEYLIFHEKKGLLNKSR